MLAQVDFTQGDDGLISPALIDLGRHHPGPNLVSFVFTILGHRDSRIRQTELSSLVNIQHLSMPLLRAVATALIEALRNERRKVLASHGTTPHLIRWDSWVQDSSRVLLLMSKHSWFTSQFNNTLFECFSIAHPDFIDDLISSVLTCNAWSENQKTAVMKDIVQLIDPSPNEGDDTLPLTLPNVSSQSWEQVSKVFDSLIFPVGMSASSLQRWNPEMKLAFRIIFGESRHDVSNELCQRIRMSSTIDELIEQLLSTISISRVQGHGLRVASYVFRLIHTHHGVPDTFNLSHLSERSWSVVKQLLVAALKDELDVRKKIEDVRGDHKWESCILNAVYVIISTTGHPHDEDGIQAVASLFQLDPEVLSDKLVLHFTKSGTASLSTAIPALLRSFVNVEIDAEDPWSFELRIPTTSAQPDMLANIVSKCLTSDLRASTASDPDKPKWMSWAIHIILSCGAASQSFSESTVSAIDKLMQDHTLVIVRAIPLQGDEKQPQFQRLWDVIHLLSLSQQLSLVVKLWPKMFSAKDSAIPMNLLRKHAKDQNRTTTDIFLCSPRELHTIRGVVNNFVYHHLIHSRTLGVEERRRYVGELQPFSQFHDVDVAWHGIRSIATGLVQILDPYWPEWMKTFITSSNDMKVFQSTFQLSENLKKCLCYNATETVALLAAQGIELLDYIPSDVLTFREKLGYTPTSAFPTYAKYPDPMLPEKAENLLMRLLLNAKIERPVWLFTTHRYFTNGTPPPRYACVSLALRVIRYCLDSRGVQIAKRDIRSPLDLSQLEKKVWDDVSAAAAEVLNYDTMNGIENDYHGGKKAYIMARMDALMVLLADSPHPLPTDLSYQVLEKEAFFRWDDSPAIEQDIRLELDTLRKARIEEGRKSRPVSGLDTGNGNSQELMSV